MVFPSAAVTVKGFYGLATENAAGAQPWQIPIHLSTLPVESQYYFPSYFYSFVKVNSKSPTNKSYFSAGEK